MDQVRADFELMLGCMERAYPQVGQEARREFEKAWNTEGEGEWVKEGVSDSIDSLYTRTWTYCFPSCFMGF
jgi:hypothetical protein